MDPVNFCRKYLTALLVTSVPGIISAQEPYFQQEVNFRIDVTLDDARHVLNAFESVEYINNSNDTLAFIYFHLWPDAYSSNRTDLAKQIFRISGKQKLFNDPLKRGGIDSLDFRVNSRIATWERLKEHRDICIVNLPDRLLPGDTIIISTPFRVKIPQGNISRMGFNENIYQISQWYPKPAVYDRNGWHQMPYLDQGEYFSEFGSFNVSITLQEDYVVGASGDLITESENEWLENTASQWRDTQLKGGSDMKTIVFKGEDIHDFAWVASKRFRVTTTDLTLPGSGKKIITRAIYTGRQAMLWENAHEYINRALLHFSDWIGDYPYNTCTMVQTSIAAGSGMEYPGMAVIGYAEDEYSLDEVIAHEVCHNWIFSAVGTNERRFPFMDEGLTTAYEERYMNLYYPGKKLWEFYFRNSFFPRLMKIDQLPVSSEPELQWLQSARENLEQPLNLPAPEYSDRNYGDLIYYKAGQGFNYLRSFLGDTVFDAVMKVYYKSWRSRHPSPDDLRTVFEEYTGRDLSWFFDDFTGTTKSYDYNVVSLKGERLTLSNKGKLNSPFSITGYFNDTVSFIEWHEGFNGRKHYTLEKSFDRLRLNADHLVPELYHTNNNIRKSGIFRKSDPLSPQLLVSVEDPERRTLMVTPLLNWNRADGFMVGASLNNGFMLPKRFEYLIMPFYKVNDPGISGKGRIAWNISPYNSLIRKLTLSLEGASFGANAINNYRTIKPGIDIWFRNDDVISETGHRSFIRMIHVTDIMTVNTDIRAGSESFWQFGHSFFRSGQLNPFDLTALYEFSGTYGKVSAAWNYRVSYYGRNKGLDIRLFAGTMIKSDPEREIYLFAPSGRSGMELYLFQGDFPDRFATFPESFWSRQMVLSEGAIISPVNDSTGFSRSVISISLESNLPGIAGRLPIRPFAAAVYAPDIRNPYLFETGVKAGFRNFFEISIPLLVSENISSIRGTVKERIRFILNLESLLKVRM